MTMVRLLGIHLSLKCKWYGDKTGFDSGLAIMYAEDGPWFGISHSPHPPVFRPEGHSP
jgi:hypothetical protein